LFGELPTKRKLAVALPALHVKVTLEEVNVDRLGGLSITDGPVVGGVGVGVAIGVAVGVGVGVGVGMPVASLKLPMRVRQLYEVVEE